jgi:hypothetical protein
LSQAYVQLRYAGRRRLQLFIGAIFLGSLLVVVAQVFIATVAPTAPSASRCPLKHALPSPRPCALGNMWLLRSAPPPSPVICENLGLRRREKTATIIDAFLLSSEADILLLRLLELDSVVDTFVVVESRESFSGNQLPLLFETYEGCFDRWENRIIRHVAEKIDKHGSAWDREAWLRNQLLVGAQNAVANSSLPHFGRLPKDILFSVSDVDEIPRAAVYSVAAQCEGYETPLPVAIQLFFYYSFHWIKQMPWVFGPVIIPVGFFVSNISVYYTCLVFLPFSRVCSGVKSKNIRLKILEDSASPAPSLYRFLMRVGICPKACVVFAPRS